MRPPLRVALVNDYEIIVAGLHEMLVPFASRVHVVEQDAGGIPDGPADVVLFDTFASTRASLTRIATMAHDDRPSKIVLYTWEMSPALASAVESAHVDGVVSKRASAVQLVDALERVVAGESLSPVPHAADVPDGADGDTLADASGPALSEREREVLALIARGHSNAMIAAELYLSVDTVKSHTRTLFRKLEVRNRTQAAVAAATFRVHDPRRSVEA